MSVTVELSELDADLWDAFKHGGEWVAASEYRKLKEQNAELRTLVTDLIRCVEETSICDNFYYKTDCDGCGIDCYVNGESCSLGKMKKRARTLGIEVEE